MGALGSVGQIYMFVLLILLFLGSGFALWSFINFLVNRSRQRNASSDNKVVSNQDDGSNKSSRTQKTIGGLIMENNGWLKLAVFSFVGILVSVVILGFISTTGTALGNSTHQQHQQDTSNMTMQGTMSGSMSTQNNSSVQQQLNQIQQQINQLQQQLNNSSMSGMNNMGSMGSSQMQQSGMSNMGGMGMMNGMMGGMNNMQQNNSSMGNMQQNSSSMSGSSSSSGSMSGMGMM